jgi:hypothetical protein
LFYAKILAFSSVFLANSPFLTLLTGLAIVPVDVIRRNYVLTQWEANLPYKNYTECANHIIKTHGAQGLFRGFYLYPELYCLGLLAFYGASSTTTSQH